MTRSFIFQYPGTLLACLAVGVFLNLPSSAESTTSFKARLQRVDFLGAGVLVLAVLSLLIGLDQASNVSLKSPVVIASLLIAIALFGAFAYIESFIASEPFAPPQIVRERTIFASSLANFFAFGSHMTVLFYVPLYYQAVRSLSPGEAGIRLLPAIAGGVSGSLLGGLLMQKTGKYYWLTVIAYFHSVVGATLVLVSVLMAESTTGISIGIIFSGFGNGIGVTSSLVAIIAAAGPKDQAVGTAVSYLFRALGTVTGVSVGSMLVQNRLRAELAARLKGDDIDEIVRKVRESMEFIGTLPEETRVVVRACYKDALQMAFMFGVGLAVLAFVSSTFIKEKRLGGR